MIPHVANACHRSLMNITGCSQIHAACGFMLLVREYGIRYLIISPVLVALGYVPGVVNYSLGSSQDLSSLTKSNLFSSLDRSGSEFSPELTSNPVEKKLFEDCCIKQTCGAEVVYII